MILGWSPRARGKKTLQRVWDEYQQHKKLRSAEAEIPPTCPYCEIEMEKYPVMEGGYQCPKCGVIDVI